MVLCTLVVLIVLFHFLSNCGLSKSETYIIQTEPAIPKTVRHGIQLTAVGLDVWNGSRKETSADNAGTNNTRDLTDSDGIDEFDGYDIDDSVGYSENTEGPQNMASGSGTLNKTQETDVWEAGGNASVTVNETTIDWNDPRLDILRKVMDLIFAHCLRNFQRFIW